MGILLKGGGGLGSFAWEDSGAPVIYKGAVWAAGHISFCLFIFCFFVLFGFSPSGQGEVGARIIVEESSSLKLSQIASLYCAFMLGSLTKIVFLLLVLIRMMRISYASFMHCSLG